ncbi:MAG TPA: M3 family oligoendopeptidase [Chthonomonadaceae bacterium]|nr:M3 family oligoendopeptidase [Chthonomonadaceae bacterium]
MTAGATALPHWDLAPIFSSLDSPEFQQAFDAVVVDIGDLAAHFDKRGARRRETPKVDAAFVAAYEEITDRLNALQQKMRTLGAYIGCFVTTDARDDRARSLQSLLDTHSVRLDQLYTRYIAWVGTSDVEALLAASEVARRHEYPVRRARELAAHQMTEAEERLAAELRPSGISAWARLHGNISALLTATVPMEGDARTLPMSAVRALANHPDRKVRHAAYEAELAAWESVSVPMAAALNGVKGYQQVVRKRRSYEDDIAPTLIANGINRQTLEAMQQACVESFPDFRRYLDARARALGLGCLAWYDIAAPVGKEARRWAWPDAETFVRENFRRYSARLADFAEKSFRERWIDAEPRVGKRGGAYCTGLRPGESRVFMNFDGSFTSVSTLAHELGHAYHNLNLKDRLPLQRGTPSTLAETASIFCETLAFDAALQHAGPQERLVLLDTALERDLQVVVDIHSRFLFERGVFARREARDLTVAEFNALMEDCQRQTYGENLSCYHKFMWAVKGHYYGPTFYNYPYTFGLLFGLGLYARYLEDADSFRQQYDDFLSSTGLADAITLSKRFGIYVEDVAFWRSSLDVIRGQIEEFERLVG